MSPFGLPLRKPIFEIGRQVGNHGDFGFHAGIRLRMNVAQHVRLGILLRQLGGEHLHDLLDGLRLLVEVGIFGWRLGDEPAHRHSADQRQQQHADNAGEYLGDRRERGECASHAAADTGHHVPHFAAEALAEDALRHLGVPGRGQDRVGRLLGDHVDA